MPLTADQQAMLQLLLERGQSYADLASLLGTDEAGVRTRARAALTELAGADPDRNVGLTDYLLGQADPIGRADAVRHLKDDPDDLELATELTQKLRLVAPRGRPPAPAGRGVAPRPRRAPRLPIGRLPIPDRLRRKRTADQSPEGASSAESARRGPRTTLSRRQTQLLVALGSGAVLVVAIVLAVSGAFSSGSDGSTPSTTASTTLDQRELRPAGLSGDRHQGPKSGKYHNTFAIPKAFQTLLPRTQAVYLEHWQRRR